MTITDTDLDWVTFAEEDPAEPCVDRSCPNEASGHLWIVDQCGPHPICLAHWEMLQGSWASTSFLVDIRCLDHDTERSHVSWPFRYVPRHR